MTTKNRERKIDAQTTIEDALIQVVLANKGSGGSGNWAHESEGRIGKVGGSDPGGGLGAIGVETDSSVQERQTASQERRQTEKKPPNRKMYKPTKNQERKWDKFESIAMPTDDEFKAIWKRTHRGKERGWGIQKRNWVSSRMTKTREYQMGIWQGRVDSARGLDYSEERNENTYNLGYYRGYDNYRSDRRGWDSATRSRFEEQYLD